VQLIGKDAADANNGGGHPWTTADGDESTLLLFNHANKPTVFNVNITAAGVTWHQEYTLVASETRSLRISALVAKEVPDLHGKKLPAASKLGEVSWYTASSGDGTGRLIVSNLQTGLARNFSCGYNIVLCGAELYNSAINLLLSTDSAPYSLGGIYGLACLAYDPNACSGQSYGDGGGGYSFWWEASSPSIATVSGSTTSASATFHGNSAGAGGGYGFISNGHCEPSAGGSATVQNITTAIQQNGLTNVILSAVANGNGSYTLEVSTANFDDPYAAEQTSGDCVCQALGQALQRAAVYVTIKFTITYLQMLQQLGLLQRERTPVQGQTPNSIQTYPSPNGPTKGKTVSVFDGNGKAGGDIDYGDQAHSGNDPEVHHWDWSSGKPTRGPGVAPQPGDIPPGYPTTWP
jgi:hypothetical protein